MDPQPTAPTPVVQPVQPPPSPSKLPWILLVVLLLAATATSGIFLGKQMANPAVVVPTPAPVAAVPTVAADPTANWQTYTNPTLNIEMKYPSNFTLLQMQGGEGLSYPNNEYEIGIFSEKSANNVDQWIKDKNLCPTDSNINNGQPCSVFTSGPISGSTQFDTLGRHYATTETVFSSNGAIFDINLAVTNPNIPISASAKSTYNQILSTFKFTNMAKICKTNADCAQDEVCAVAGPIAIDPVTKQQISQARCYPKGQPLPL